MGKSRRRHEMKHTSLIFHGVYSWIKGLLCSVFFSYFYNAHLKWGHQSLRFWKRHITLVGARLVIALKSSGHFSISNGFMGYASIILDDVIGV